MRMFASDDEQKVADAMSQAIKILDHLRHTDYSARNRVLRDLGLHDCDWDLMMCNLEWFQKTLPPPSPNNPDSR